MPISFRDWLIARIRLTKYATNIIPDERIDRVAMKLGVQPDVLLAARAEMRILRAERGFLRNVRYRQIEMTMPPEIWEAWKDECAFREIDGPALLRSIVHDYLLSSYEPKEPLRHWRFRGKLYFASRQTRNSARERAGIPMGAIRALNARAGKTGATAHGIMRSLMIEVLEGGYRGVRIVDAKSMYDDERRYAEEAAARQDPNGTGRSLPGK